MLCEAVPCTAVPMQLHCAVHVGQFRQQLHRMPATNAAVHALLVATWLAAYTLLQPLGYWATHQ